MKKSEEIIGDPNVSVFGSSEQLEIEIDVARYISLARLTLAKEKIVGICEMSLIFCDEDSITKLNEQYMGASGPTDVLAFPVVTQITVVVDQELQAKILKCQLL